MKGDGSLPLGEVVRPNRPRVNPRDYPQLPFVGMEHVEPHSMRLLATVPAATMKSSAVHFMPGDVLYGRLRPYLNKVYRPTFEGLCSAEFIVLPENEQIEGSYLKYFLNSAAFVRYASHINAGDRPRVDFEQLAPYHIPLPPRPIQLAIVAEIEKQFSRLDEAIANLNRLKMHFRRYRAAVLKAAVEGRLVRTEAELVSRGGRQVETGEELLAGILEERRKTWTGGTRYSEPAPPSLDAAIPKGWTWCTMEQLLASLRNGLSRKPHDEPPGAGILRISGVRPLRFNASDIRFYRRMPDERTADFEVRNGDLLFVRYNGSKELVGACAMVEGLSSEPLLYPDKLIRGRVVDASLTLPGYLAIAANVGTSRSHIEALIKTTAGQQGVAGADIKRIPIPMPPIAEQRRIVAEVDRRLSIVREVDAQVDANLKRARALREAVLRAGFEPGGPRYAQFGYNATQTGYESATAAEA